MIYLAEPFAGILQTALVPVCVNITDKYIQIKPLSNKIRPFQINRVEIFIGPCYVLEELMYPR